MKKIISLLLLAAISLSLSSCMFMLGSYNLIPSVDMNGKEKYIPCEEDFASTDIPLGSASFYESFLPTKSCLYYYSLTNKGEATLYRADKNGTERIAKSGDDKLSGYILDDWIIKKEKSNVFFTAYDDETFASKLFCYDENEKSYQEIFSTKEGYELWDICGGKFVYMPYNDSYEDDESYPYCLYPIVSADL